MAFQVHKIGDKNSGNGVITSVAPNSDCYAENQLISINGSNGTGHPPCPDVPIHCTGAWVTTGGAANVLVHNTPVNHTSNPDSCGHNRIDPGASTVLVG